MGIQRTLVKNARELMTRISPKLNNYVLYRYRVGGRLNLKDPKTLNAKVVWLKFNTYKDNPLIKQCADKYRVREYIEKNFGDSILNPLYKACFSPKEVPWDELPNQFVLKMNVGCGFNYIVTDKKKENIKELQNMVESWFKEAPKYYLKFAELQYKDVQPVLLIEELLENYDGTLPEDFKFYCFNGKTKYVMVCVGRNTNKKAAFYYFNRDWELMPFTEDYYKNPNVVIPKPKLIDEAFDVAEALSKDFPFVRTDLYIVKDKIIFGELTFTPSAGLDRGRLKTTDILLGEELDLTDYKKA